MPKINLDRSRLLGFRLLPADEAENPEALAVLAAKVGKACGASASNVSATPRENAAAKVRTKA